MPCDTGSVGLLKWFRNSAGESAGMLSAGLGELEAFLSPSKRQALDNLKSMSLMRDDEQESGAPPRAVDLTANTAVIKVRGKDTKG
jgi:hypothetical protein